MTFKATGMFDRSGVAALSCIKSVEAGSTYFGVQIPECADGHVRIDIKRGYHYFQRIDDTKTRYVTIFNSDPKLQYAPSWMTNYFMTKICYQMLVVIQEKAVKVPESEFGERMKRRRDFYGDVERMIAEFARESDEAKPRS